MMDDIKKMTMGFQYYGEKSVDEARELLVYSVECYLTAINENEEIRPYLHNYPFTSKNVEVDIYFRKIDGHTVPIGEINVASSNQGLVTYFIDNPEGTALQEYHEESFEEAQRIYYESLSNTSHTPTPSS